MGDCASRPTKETIEDHSNYQFHQFDNKFYTRPALPYLKDIVDAPITTAEQQERYQGFRNQLQKDIKEFNKIKGTQPSSAGPSKSYVAVEIGRGVNFYPDTLCIQAARPYVVVKVNPIQTWIQTVVCQPMIPKFNHYSQIDTKGSHFDTVDVTVLMERRIGGPLEYGKIVFSFEQLSDQEVKSGWFDLTGTSPDSEGTKPKLYLRIQFISNLAALLQSHHETAEVSINEATKALALCNRLLTQVRVGPEGRGDAS